MTINLTQAQAELLNDALAMQIQIEMEHLSNHLDSISKHKTLSIIQCLRRIKDKLNEKGV